MTNNFINLTPHPINILDDNGNEVLNIPASGWELRLVATTVPAFTVGVVKISKTEFGEITLTKGKSFNGQPSPESLFADSNVFFIVSQLVKGCIDKGGTSFNGGNFLVPAEVVRDDKGNIVGCKSLGV